MSKKKAGVLLLKNKKTEANQCPKKRRSFCFEKKKKQRQISVQKNGGHFASKKRKNRGKSVSKKTEAVLLPKKEKTEGFDPSKKRRPFCFQKTKKQRQITTQKKTPAFLGVVGCDNSGGRFVTDTLLTSLNITDAHYIVLRPVRNYVTNALLTPLNTKKPPPHWWGFNCPN